LLSKLDGLEDNEGLCIVATTNHPERIDPALLRPGRFGMHVVMSEADHDMMTNILAAAYDLTSDDDMLRLREQLQGVPEYVWTPSQLIQLSVELETPGECVVALSRATTAFHTRGCSGRAPRS
jgi:SpoVK/Ycf46/Vps4 family AAA+-type ATPase